MLISSIFANSFDCYKAISQAKSLEEMNILAQILSIVGLGILAHLMVGKI